MNDNNGMPMPSTTTLPGETEAETTPVVETPVEPAVEYVDPKNSDNQIKVPKISAKGIAVTAIRKGFYGQMRRGPGEKFKVKDETHLGEWMTCDDTDYEKERSLFFKAKKKRIQAAIKEQRRLKKANK